MKYNLKIICFVFTLFEYSNCYKDWSDDQDPEKWNKLAKETLDNILSRKINKNIAKNLIIFIGDGMGISTVTAGRIRKGQLKGNNGEETVTNMENLPHVALSKTYNIDAQTADSAGTGTAYLCGVKTRAGIVGLNGYAIPHDCPSSHNNKIDSILKWAHKAGKSTGIVTTTRITHATPAAAYAHSAFRDWESLDGIKFTKKQHSLGCKDIATQLIEDNNFINVIIGGGRMKFFPTNQKDVSGVNNGTRIDDRDLLEEWNTKMKSLNKTHKFIWNATDFRSTNFKAYDHILGLLAYDNLRYETDRNNTLEPSLVEMTLKTIELLSKNKNGYFLLVEGGRIDHAHHENRAHKALDDFVVFDETIGQVVEITSQDDTMIVVTADHSHTFTLGGNSLRGNSVYGLALTKYSNLSDSNLTFTSLMYGNGPGGLHKIRTYNLTNKETENKEYIQEAVVYKKLATHGGEDVSIYASGPMSFLFTNTIEQNFITHAMAYSACIGPYSNEECKYQRGILSNENLEKSKTSINFDNKENSFSFKNKIDYVLLIIVNIIVLLFV